MNKIIKYSKYKINERYHVDQDVRHLTTLIIIYQN